MQPIRRMVGYVRTGPETSINTDELRRSEERFSVTNRLRKVIYDNISRVRHQMNGVIRQEPP
jgi:hypothetical protein